MPAPANARGGSGCLCYAYSCILYRSRVGRARTHLFQEEWHAREGGISSLHRGQHARRLLLGGIRGTDISKDWVPIVKGNISFKRDNSDRMFKWYYCLFTGHLRIFS